MKKSMFFMLAVLLCGITGGCQGSKGDGSETKADSVAVKADTLTAEEEQAMNDSIKNFLSDMYNRMLFQEDTFLTNHCSDAVMEKLKADYSTKYKGEGLAYWDFRSDKDGEGDLYCIGKITVEEDHWYKYTFYDMGLSGMHRIRILVEPDRLVIDSLQ